MLPLVWISYEYMHCRVTSLFDQSGAPLISLAYTQADNAIVAQIADLGGAGLISLIVAAMNGFFAHVTHWVLIAHKGKTEHSQVARLVVFPLVLVTVLAYGQIRIGHSSPTTGPTVCLLGSSDLPPLLKEGRIPQTSSTAREDPRRPNLFVWPELSYHHVLVAPHEDPHAHAALDEACPLANGDVLAYGRKVRNFLEVAAAKFNAGIVMGCERIAFSSDSVQRYNCLAIANPTTGLVGWYDKCHLAPFTEFTPSGGEWLQIVKRKDFTAGRDATPFVFRSSGQNAEYRVGCGLCYDVAFAEHFRQQLLDGVSFFVVGR